MMTGRECLLLGMLHGHVLYRKFSCMFYYVCLYSLGSFIVLCVLCCTLCVFNKYIETLRQNQLRTGILCWIKLTGRRPSPTSALDHVIFHAEETSLVPTQKHTRPIALAGPLVAERYSQVYFQQSQRL